jgi:hypothetical protein
MCTSILLISSVIREPSYRTDFFKITETNRPTSYQYFCVVTRNYGNIFRIKKVARHLSFDLFSCNINLGYYTTRNFVEYTGHLVLLGRHHRLGM